MKKYQCSLDSCKVDGHITYRDNGKSKIIGEGDTCIHCYKIYNVLLVNSPLYKFYNVLLVKSLKYYF